MAKRPAKSSEESDETPSAKPSGKVGKGVKAAAKSAGPEVSGPAAWRVAIFHGKEAFLRAEKTAALRDALAAAYGDIDTPHFDGTTCQAADVLDECRSFGLIARHKMVVLDSAEALVKEETRPLFERYAESPAEGATLVLRADTWRPGNLDKMVAKVGVVEKCEEFKDAEARDWATRRAKSHHASEIDTDAAILLIERVGGNLAKIDSELGKLSAAAGKGARITAQHVSYFTGASREEAVWSIQGTLLNAGPEEALQHLRYVLDVSRQPEQLVMWALVDLARKVHGACRALKNGASPGEIARPLKLWGPSQYVVMEAAKRTTPGRALRLLRTCIEADQRTKSGLGETDRTLERVVLQFARLLQA